MRFTALILLLFASAITSASPLCEEGLSTPGRRFLRALNSGVASGDVSAENLAWMIAQPVPVDPILETRSPENLALKKIFRQEVPRISRQEWNLIVAQARQIAKQESEKLAKVRDAQKTTENVFVMRRAFEFPPRRISADVFPQCQGHAFRSDS